MGITNSRRTVALGIACCVARIFLVDNSGMAQSTQPGYNAMTPMQQGMELGRRFDKARAGDYSPEPPYPRPYVQQPDRPNNEIADRYQQLLLRQYLERQQMEQIHHGAQSPSHR